jgi:hypothetical protein
MIRVKFIHVEDPELAIRKVVNYFDQAEDPDANRPWRHESTLTDEVNQQTYAVLYMDTTVLGESRLREILFRHILLHGEGFKHRVTIILDSNENTLTSPNLDKELLYNLEEFEKILQS